MADEERLLVSLEARINQFEKQMKKAERTGTRSYNSLRRNSGSATRAMERDMNRATANINRSLATASTKIGAFGKTFLAGVAGSAITVGLSAVTSNLGQVVKGIAAVGDEAKRAGVPLQDFQEWKFVAQQNRIGIDSMVDGLKELNLRADEFIATGKGPAEEAFRRLGFGARDLERRLEDPSELLLEIVDRLQDMDRAAQIRISDEIFGGTAGERFVELLGQGRQGLQATIQEAHRVGAVMDSEMIEKADELDRKFQALTERVGQFGKQVAVSLADLPFDVIEERLDDIFRSEEAGRAILGDEIYDRLREAGELAEDQADSVRHLAGEYQGLREEAGATANTLTQAINLMRAWGYDEAAAQLAQAAEEMRTLSDQFEDGSISGEEFAERMGDVQTQAVDAFNALEDVDRVEFSGAISAVERLGSSLSGLLSIARSVKEALPGGGASDPVNRGRGGDPRGMGGSIRDWRNRTATDEAPASSPRPRPAPPMIHENIPATGASGGGGGSADVGEYQREVEAIREQTQALQAEAVALVAVAESGQEYGDAIEFARRKAELLHAAQQEGREITPELRAEIDNLALAYTTAGQNAEDAANTLEQMEMNAERGRDRMADLFGSIIDGSMSAKDALVQLLMEIAKVQMQKGLLGMIGSGGGGGVFGWLGGLLGGARADGGPVKAGVPYLVNEGTPNSEVFVPSRSGAVLNVPQAQRALSQSASGGRAQEVRVVVEGGDLVLTDNGQVAAAMRVTAKQSGVAAVAESRRRHGAWSSTMHDRGTMR
ncbi:phage tail tape measure protein [Tranquillimonas alkanivorans]|uniref:Phage-related minor tail protein n=1 Tax=Tranquillimonas alkanivorans TaxID=441119 RepID=A0A1I5RVX7_9RHOB|nr:phage tail tape measure protein [Tranquillimonas alkanivorans]SFP62577.1 Phage-related minor tail protein [Tranquillimonas alkanivorans]